MQKSILHRLFKVGSIPRKLRPILEEEGIVLSDEGMVCKIYVDAADQEKLSVSFESSDFRDGWKGVIEYRFKTDKAIQFQEALTALGVQKGTSADAE